MARASEWLPLVGVALVLIGLEQMGWVGGGDAGSLRGLGAFCGGVILIIASIVEIIRGPRRPR